MSKQDWKDFFYFFVFVPATVAAYSYCLVWFLDFFVNSLPWPTLCFNGG